MPMPSSRQAGRISPSIPREISEYSICTSLTIGAPDRVGADLGKTDMADIACLHHVGDCADGLVNRHRRVETRGTVNIDIVGAQPAERISEEHQGLDSARIEATKLSLEC